MNKRIKKKKEKRINLKRQKEILEQIKMRYIVDDVSFTPLNTECYFTIKDTPNWQYVIKLNRNDFSILLDHNEVIDKYKKMRYLEYNNIQDFIFGVRDIKKGFLII